MKVKVVRRRSEATDICVFELGSPDGRALPSFSAGAHIDVHLTPGLVRQYSLCNAPNETHRYVIGVLRDPKSRGGSVAMHALAEDAIIDISAPKNHFPLEAQAGHSILLAGGIGVTPILCMAQALASEDASFEMHYCTRSPDRTAFRDRLAQPDLVHRARVYFDSGPPEGSIDLKAIFAHPVSDSHVYVCGPGGFIDLVLTVARQAGWPESNLHREYFSAAARPAGEQADFSVQIASTGAIIAVPAGKTVVQALAEQGIEVLTSCEQGVCGTCLTRVLSGTPDHRDSYLSDDERAAGDRFLPCCSRAKSPLLLLDL